MTEEPQRMRVDWTPEIIAALRVLWDEGLSANAIAKRMGMTRNQVIAKASRQKFPGRTPAIDPEKARKTRQEKSARAAAEIIAAARRAVIPAAPPAPKTKPAARHRELPNMQRLALIQAKTLSIKHARPTMPQSPQPTPMGGGCRFISGDPVELVAKGIDPFCGKPRDEGSSYCPAHHAVCWYRPTKRSAREEAA